MDGRELVAYSPVKLQPEDRPAPVTSFPPAAEMKTNEELYLAGLRIEQFHAPNAKPDPYWQEALKRDPGDVRVNTALGIDAIKAGRFAEAEQYLRKALERATDRSHLAQGWRTLLLSGFGVEGTGEDGRRLRAVRQGHVVRRLAQRGLLRNGPNRLSAAVISEPPLPTPTIP